MENLKEIEAVTKTTLQNGLRIVTEKIDSVKSISVGIWVKTGSRNESDELAGVTHFLEHMLFKGTDSRSAYDIALSMESVGGYLNAFTSSEYTCYYARCVDAQLPRALDVLSDMVLNPSFPEEEIEKEKKVVIEEMKMYRDSPDDYLFEEFSSKMFEGHPLGRPVLGFEKTVSEFKREDLYNYMSERYVPENMLISVAGNVDHDQVEEIVREYFGAREPKKVVNVEQPIAEFKPEKLELTKSIEQTHYVLGRRGLFFDHEDKYLLLMANTILGGGMSSRLHQNVREKYGYCYSIQTFNQSYSDAGIWGVYVGTDKDYVEHVHELVVAELDKIRTELIPEKELNEAKSQLKGKLLLSQENTSNRMMRLAKGELYYDRFVTLDELEKNIEEVTSEQILEFSKDFFDQKYFMEAVLTPEEEN
ncbi:MAG TPA: insulinase family protein [Balneolaceae bacterium]|nr:insulinase family protein [Balneolaceae bacterium]|tara:strand:+ start:134018 stop:135274 length:1257 start_codon:yes stop_codon:yes gene_type:complete